MREGRKRGVASSPPPPAGGGKGEGASGRSLLVHAHEMRRDATPAERKLWRLLRDHQAGGMKFRRQVPLGRYIADFYCAAAKLVVELDSVSHIDPERDAVRDEWMMQHGYRTLRFSNYEVLSNAEGVAAAIVQAVRQPPPPDPLPQGEGEFCYSSSSSYAFADRLCLDV